jgi:60 kDa SS-A/Ro ribonucleoprotein
MPRNDPLATYASTTRKTPQNQPAGGATERNNAGGYVFAVGEDAQIQRFLTLGTTGGTYYVGEREHTAENAALVVKVAKERGRWLVQQAVQVSGTGRAPRQRPAIFALAAVASFGDDDARAYALDHLPVVCRTGSTLATFAGYVDSMRGWGRGLRRAVGEWYTAKAPDQLAYQLLKYRQREGWTHRDLLRLAHPKATDPQMGALFAYAVGKGRAHELVGSLPELVKGFETAQRVTDVGSWVNLAADFELSWEMFPDAALTEPRVWRALLEHGRVPTGAMLRQLPRLTRLGVLDDTELRGLVTTRLTSEQALKRARIHPINVLVAQKTYAAGRGRGSSWTPNSRIVDALDQAFYAAFGAVVPSGGRTLVALDVSASMTWGSSQIAGMPLNAREASAAMALVTLATERDAHPDVVGFTSGGWSPSGHLARTAWGRVASGIERLDISPRRRLDDVVSYVGNLSAGGTDAALPMLWATERGESYDTFVIYTDNETWAGGVHPHQALTEHRERLNPKARLVVCAMTSTGFSIADPADPGQLDVVGFDSATPQLIADFAGGRL